MAFDVDFSLHAGKHVRALRKRDQQIILDAISANLRHEPEKPTRNRKKLDEHPIAPWELRIGDFRVFFDVIPEENLVVIVAVGEKRHNDLWIDDEKVDL